MAKFDPKIWEPIRERLKVVRSGIPFQKFQSDHGLLGFRWDFIELGKQGCSIETLVKICDALDLSPTWIVYGVGPRKRSSITEAAPLVDDLLLIDTLSERSYEKCLVEIRSILRRYSDETRNSGDLQRNREGDAGSGTESARLSKKRPSSRH